MLPRGRKSAEPAKAGREGTSNPETGPASESAKERETEPMAEAPSGGSSPTRKWVRQSKDLWSANARLMGACQGPRENPRSAAGKACKARKPESTRGRVGAYSGRGERRNLGTARVAAPPGRMTKATDERAKRGQSPRSSLRTGKPSTWRRRAGRQYGSRRTHDLFVAVNTGSILDMQRKLYRWSAADPDKRFADLFNVVCDRGTLASCLATAGP